MSTNAILNTPPLPPRQRPSSSSITIPSVSDSTSYTRNSVSSTTPLSSQFHSAPLYIDHNSTSTPVITKISKDSVVSQVSQEPSIARTQCQLETDSSISSSSQPPIQHNGDPLPSTLKPQLPARSHVNSQELDTAPYRRSLDAQRSTLPTLLLNSGKPFPLQPKGQAPSAITITCGDRPVSSSAPASASVSNQEHPHPLLGANILEHQYLLAHSSPSSPSSNSHRVSTSSVSTDASYPFSDDADLSRLSLDQQRQSFPAPPPPYSLSVGNQGSSTLITSSIPPSITEGQIFQVQGLTPPPIISTLSTSQTQTQTTSHSLQAQHQYICANPMHDQQYLLVGSGNALHSIDLTLPSDKQTVKTHIQGLAFKEIHCLEDIGLVVVIAGRNSRVRCYDYDSIKRLVTYGHSKEGQGRVVEGGKLGAMKNMIQLRVETVISREENQNNNESPNISPAGQSIGSRFFKGSSPSTTPQPQQQQLNRHQHTHSADRSSLLSPPLRSENLGTNFDYRGSGGETSDSNSDGPAAAIKKNKQRPLSFAGLASLAQEHMRNKAQSPPPLQSLQPGNQQSSSHGLKGTSPTSPPISTRNRRLSQMASYLSQAAVNSNMAAHMTAGQDVPSGEAVDWAWDFTKLKQTKDVLALDFHYTPSTVYMTVLSKTGIDIYCRPKAARGRKLKQSSIAVAAPSGYGSNPDDNRRSIISPGGSTSRDSLSIIRDNPNSYEWKIHKQFYHPEAPSFMAVVKDSQEVTDIILGKGAMACVVNVKTMSVNDLHRLSNSGNGGSGGNGIHGLGKKLGFKNSPLWHSFEKIPFDVPPYILYPEAAAAIYDARGDTKERYRGQESDTSSIPSDYGRRSRDDIMQRPSAQHNIHTKQVEEQERAEADIIALKLQQSQLLGVNNASSSNSSSSSSLTSTLVQQPNVIVPAPNHSSNISNGTSNGNGNGAKASQKARMVTSDEVLNMAFCQRTTTQLFLATYGSQSRIVDIQGKPQSPIVLDWESSPPQKVEFLKTNQDIYAVGFEKSSIVAFSLTRAKKVKEISKQDLIQAADAAATATVITTTGGSEATGNRGNRMSVYENNQALASTTVPSRSLSVNTANAGANSSSIKFLGRDNIADGSLGIFFSYCHPRNGTSICKLVTVPTAQDDLELIGYYH